MLDDIDPYDLEVDEDWIYYTDEEEDDLPDVSEVSSIITYPT